MAICPPGFLCLSNGVISVIMVVTGLIFYLLLTLVNKEKQEVIQRTIIQERQPEYREQSEEPGERDIHEPPEREYRGRQRGMPINVRTRAQDSYQQVGVLYKISVVNTSSINTPGNNAETSVLPLFGRRVYSGSNLWNYYTSSSDHSIVKIPLHINGENCTKDRGCAELTNGSTVSVSALNGSYKVEIYEYDAPKYIPYVF